MTEAEIKRAKKEAEYDAKELGLLLLLAFTSQDKSKVANVSFDRNRGRFIVNGRAVTVRSIISYLERINQRQARRLGKLTNDLAAGTITLDEWKRSFDRTIKSTHILAGAFALGGIAVAVKNSSLITQIDEQLSFADTFAEEVRDGRAGTFARIKSRAKSYIQAAHISFSQLELELVKQTGFRKEAFNLLRPAEHCFTKQRIGCPELTARGWMLVDEMIPIGKRQCTRFCKCRVIYR